LFAYEKALIQNCNHRQNYNLSHFISMQTPFQALVLTELEGKTQAQVQQLTRTDLPAGDTLVAVSYSSLNYKDAMALTGKGKIVRQFPMVPGIDLVGTVMECSSGVWKAGDAVVLTGWGVGERFWGGYSQVQCVKSEWLTPLPKGMTALQSMTLGTAGLTAMLCVMALEAAALPKGKILVTGASGGVGSVALALLSRLGFEVTALTSRPEENQDYLTKLGATVVLGTAQWQTKISPLAAQRWAGVVDVAGGAILAQALSEVLYGGAVAASGLAASASLETTVLPFILRGVRLQGVDSVMCPQDKRSQAWERLASLCSADAYADMQRIVGLTALPALATEMMAGKAHGRVVVDLKAAP
jgi:acrylyl-CoA reductase (NADPH)